ncbi:hypothetical protein P5776_004390 [Vibrio parahaemolyticus]|nr:hypothetical protein [Vibrio parahaemolyticus]
MTEINRGKKEQDIKKHLNSLFDERYTEELKIQRKKKEYFHKVSFDELDEAVNSTDIATSSIPAEPDFIKLYLKDVVTLKGIQPANKDILYCLLKLMRYENYVISITKYDKTIICKELGLKRVQQVDNAITSLKKAGILFPIVDENGKKEQGAFEVNPYLFGKGKWVENYNKRDINKLTVLYRKNNKEVINVDALIEYIKSETDEEKRNEAIEKLKEIRGES